MLNALRASVMLLILVGTARAGEGLIPPAPPQMPTSTSQESSDTQMPADGTATPEAPVTFAGAVLELLAILPALI